MKSDKTYLGHILDAIGQIENYTRIASREEFLENSMMHDAVIRQIEIIGEASHNVSAMLQEQHSEIPWGQIVGMRNRVVHAYFDIDLDIAWDIVKSDLPVLKSQVQKLLE
jgi:uncharacterized protein with HEPN domain